jgi:hypothetical protein
MKKNNIIVLFFTTLALISAFSAGATTADRYNINNGSVDSYNNGYGSGNYYNQAYAQIDGYCGPDYAWNQYTNSCEKKQVSDCLNGYSTVSGQYSYCQNEYGNYYGYENYQSSYDYQNNYQNICSYAEHYIPEGATIRARNSIDVYIVKYLNNKQFKRLVLNPNVFENYGHLKWENIMNVDPGALDCYTTSDLVRVDGRREIFKLYPSGDYGTKRLIEPTAYSKYYIDQDSVYTINWYDMNSYSWGIPLG